MSSSHLKNFISSLERKARNANPSNDYIVDITTMNVVDDGKRRSTRQSTQRNSTPLKSRSSAINNVEYVVPAGITSTSQQISIYRPPANSDLFNQEYQVNGLQEIYEILLNEDKDGRMRKHLIEKAFQTLCLKSLPSSDTVHPFIHISDEGSANITFLYDSPPFTPWRSYIDVIYPIELLNLSRKIYKFLLNPLAFQIASKSTRNSIQGNLQAKDEDFDDTESETSDDLSEEYLPNKNKSNSRRLSHLKSRSPKKLLTTTIEAVLDPSDVSSTGAVMRRSIPKRKCDMTEPIETVHDSLDLSSTGAVDVRPISKRKRYNTALQSAKSEIKAKSTPKQTYKPRVSVSTRSRASAKKK